jgi:hypothetical protein
MWFLAEVAQFGCSRKTGTNSTPCCDLQEISPFHFTTLLSHVSTLNVMVGNDRGAVAEVASNGVLLSPRGAF